MDGVTEQARNHPEKETASLSQIESVQNGGGRQKRSRLSARGGQGGLSRTYWLLAGLTLLFAFWLFFHWALLETFNTLLPQAWNELLWLFEAGWLLTLTAVWIVYWRRRARPSPPPPEMDLVELYALDPADFERYVGKLFRRKGYKVELRGRTGDMGVDLLVTRPGGKKAIVQCKRYRHTVGANVVRELYGTLVHEAVAHAFLVTTAEISEAAREWAAGKPITLIDGEALEEIVAALSRPVVRGRV